MRPGITSIVAFVGALILSGAIWHLQTRKVTRAEAANLIDDLISGTPDWDAFNSLSQHEDPIIKEVTTECWNIYAQAIGPKAETIGRQGKPQFDAEAYKRLYELRDLLRSGRGNS